MRCFWEALLAEWLDSRSLGRGIRVGAVGPATAKALRERGIHADFMPETATAEHMARGLISLCGSSLAGSRILLPRARKAGDALPDILAEHGAAPDILPIYETVPVAARLRDVLDGLEAGEVDCVLFTSASTVTHFLEQIPAETLRRYPQVRLACIGPITAKALAAAGLPCHIQPDRATIPDLVRLLVRAF